MKRQQRRRQQEQRRPRRRQRRPPRITCLFVVAISIVFCINFLAAHYYESLLVVVVLKNHQNHQQQQQQVLPNNNNFAVQTKNDNSNNNYNDNNNNNNNNSDKGEDEDETKEGKNRQRARQGRKTRRQQQQVLAIVDALNVSTTTLKQTLAPFTTTSNKVATTREKKTRTNLTEDVSNNKNKNNNNNNNIINNNNNNSNNNKNDENKKQKKKKFCYVFLIAGVNPDEPSGYFGYYLNLFVAKFILDSSGSTQADVMVMIRMAHDYVANNATATANNDANINDDALRSKEKEEATTARKTTTNLLPRDLHGALVEAGIRVEYLPQTKHRAYDTFFTAMMDKFQMLKYTEYSHLLYMDSDVIPLCNLDYLFEKVVVSSSSSTRGDGGGGGGKQQQQQQQALSPVLASNLILTWTSVPANGGFFLLENQKGDYEQITRDYISNYTFDKIHGFGHEIQPGDEWKIFSDSSIINMVNRTSNNISTTTAAAMTTTTVENKKNNQTTPFTRMKAEDEKDQIAEQELDEFLLSSTSSKAVSAADLEHRRTWNFYGSHADQGLLYHWVKYVKKNVTIIRGPTAETFVLSKSTTKNKSHQTAVTVNDNNSAANLTNRLTSTLVASQKKVFGPGCGARILRKATARQHPYFRYAPYTDFYHYTSDTKPFLVVPDPTQWSKYTLINADYRQAKTPLEVWFTALYQARQYYSSSRTSSRTSSNHHRRREHATGGKENDSNNNGGDSQDEKGIVVDDVLEELIQNVTRQYKKKVENNKKNNVKTKQQQHHVPQLGLLVGKRPWIPVPFVGPIVPKGFRLTNRRISRRGKNISIKRNE